jgi:hypothetical protein
MAEPQKQKRKHGSLDEATWIGIGAGAGATFGVVLGGGAGIAIGVALGAGVGVALATWRTHHGHGAGRSGPP